MKFTYVILFSGACLLGACSLSRQDVGNNTYEAPKLQSGEVLVFGKPVKIETISITGVTESAVPKIEQISKISELSELRKFNQEANDFGTGSLELQKNQLLLHLKKGEITDPQFKSLRAAQENIIKGYAIWPETLKNLEKTLIDTSKISQNETDIQNARENFLTNLREFQKSDSYKNYLTSQSSELSRLEVSIRAYYTDEMKLLEKNILDAQAKLQNTSATK